MVNLCRPPFVPQRCKCLDCMDHSLNKSLGPCGRQAVTRDADTLPPLTRRSQATRDCVNANQEIHEKSVS